MKLSLDSPRLGHAFLIPALSQSRHGDMACETLYVRKHVECVSVGEPNEGKTIIEKFEKHSDVAGFAVVLLTPDDFGGPAGHPEKALPRARQNVVLELGYFMGKLGRGRVCCLYVDGVELPSDYQGVLWLPYDDSGAWRDQLARELVAAGIAFDSQALAAAAKKTSDADINTLIHLGKMRSLKDLA